MRLHRFYVSQPLGEEVVIEDVSLIHQWTHVFRYTINDSVILFNGDGNDCCYSIQEVHKKSCTLQRSTTNRSYIPSRHITLCLSCIKKDNFELAIQKATELGITSFIPVLSSRSEKKNLSFERLEKIVIESAEQCGRGDIPSLQQITPLSEVLDLISSSSSSRGIAFNMDGTPLQNAHEDKPNTETFILVGPEGGWSVEELILMKQHNVTIHSLGNTVLRTETAAIAACTCIMLL